MENLWQGAKDIFLAKVRADFDAIEDQALKSSKALKEYSLIGTDPMADMLFTQISDTTSEGSRAVWRHVGTTGVRNLGNRVAGGKFPVAEFIRGYETAVFDPDNQVAGQFQVPEEREKKEGSMYKSILNRASKLLYEVDRINVADPFEVFNLAFTASTSFPTSGVGGNRFFVRGNYGLDGNNTALAERLVSTQHARADAGTTISNAVQSSGNARAFSDEAYWAAREQGATFLDDVGKEMPMFGGKVTIVVPPANSLVRTAKEIDMSDWVIASMENQVNVHKNQFTRIITSPYLLASSYVSGVANTAQWFLVDDSTRDPEVGTSLVCISFVPLATKVYRDQTIDSVVYDVKQEKSYGFVDWRNILGSNGTGAAYSS